MRMRIHGAFAISAIVEQPTVVAKPFSWGVPFAPETAKVWPVVTKDPRGKAVPYLTESGTIVAPGGFDVSAERHFGARREGGARRHAGVDLVIKPGDHVVACKDGVVLGTIYGFAGLDAVVIDHGDFIAVYAEVAPGSLKKAGLAKGSSVKAGDTVAYGASSSNGTMLHLETWAPGHAPKAFTPWRTGSTPAGLLDPTKILLGAR